MGVEIPAGYGVAAIRFSCTGIVDPIISTFGFDWQDAANPASTADQDATALMGALTSSTTKLFSAQQFSTEWTVQGITVNENRAGTMVIGVSTTAPVTGAAVSASLPANCSFLVRKGTALNGRRGRGRMYLPPCFISEGQVNPNGVIVGSLAATQTRLNLYLTDLIAMGLPMVLLHAANVDDFGEPQDPAAPPPTPVTSLTIQTLIATQRRRIR